MLGSGGAPLDAAFRARAESFLGTDLAHVRVHTDAAAVESARSVQGHAYTSGSHIVFGPGMYDTSSAGGQHRLAHELTHVVQQQRGGVAGTVVPGGLSVSDPSDRFERAAVRSADAFVSGAGAPPNRSGSGTESPGGDSTVQRDVGFEFEATNLRLWEAENPDDVPAGAFPDAAAVERLGPAEAKHRLAKGEADTVLRHPSFDVQPDDQGTEESDPEIVTTHFTEDDPGRALLVTALGAMRTMNDKLKGQAPMGAVPVGKMARAGIVVVKSAAFINQSWRALKPMSDGFVSAPQVTMGLDLANVSTIVKDLHGSNRRREKPGHAVNRAPGRLMLRRHDPADGAKPIALSDGGEANTLVVGSALARRTLRTYRATNPDAPVGPELEGLLTLIYAYCEGVRYKSNFLKSHTPLMAKTDFATVWTTLPDPVRDYYGTRPKVNIQWVGPV